MEMQDAEVFKVTTVTKSGKSIVVYVAPERRQTYVRAMREQHGGNSVTVEPMLLADVPEGDVK